MNGRLSNRFVNEVVAVRGVDSVTIRRGQHLAPDNSSPNLDEGLEARIKDPLWFLARQWQTGEFEAENGGKLAQLEVTWSSYPITELERIDEGSRPIPEGVPLQLLVEAESDTATSVAWRAEALEYEFRVRGSSFEFAAQGYDGSGLDWYHFDLENQEPSRPDGKDETQRVIPTNLAFPGMPHPRWWQFEEGDTYVDAFENADPNPLSLILPEFLIADANNWFIVPVDQRVGAAREMEVVRAVDSFGVVSEVPPVSEDGQGWQMFTHSPLLPDGAALGSKLLLVADLGRGSMEGEPIEEVVFLRDEDANLVWAIEELFFDEEVGGRVRPGPDTDPGLPPGTSEVGFRLRSDIPRHWIPYLPRPLDEFGQIFLRRARSSEEFSGDNPQYRSRIVAEASMLNEEEIPTPGVRVTRLWRAAVGIDGERRFWVGRRKSLTARHAGSGLEYDYLG